MNLKVVISAVSSSFLIISTCCACFWFTITHKKNKNEPTGSPTYHIYNTTHNPNLNVTVNETMELNCGLKIHSQSLRIINGNNAGKNSWPWMVSLRIFYRNSNSFSGHFCGGSLIDAQTVLTAAHCVVDHELKNDIAVVIGINSIKEPLTTFNTFFVSKIISHQNYNASLIKNDVALIRLSKPVPFSEKVYPVCLPPSSVPANFVYNKEVILIGWGSTNGINSQSNLATDLQETKLEILNGNEICSFYTDYDIHKIYCALDPIAEIGSNACFGDSGGPLLFKIGKYWFQYGITSFVLTKNKGDCNPTVPSYYTQVPAYLDWIVETHLKLI